MLRFSRGINGTVEGAWHTGTRSVCDAGIGCGMKGLNNSNEANSKPALANYLAVIIVLYFDCTST